MWSWLIENLLSSLTGWLGLTGVIVVIALVVAWFIKPLRLPALAVAGAAMTIAWAYVKGDRDRAKLEKRRQDEAVRKVKEKYDEIDRNPTTHDDLARRLRDGSF